MRIAIAGFIIPFMAVYTPALMLQAGGPLAESIGYPAAVAYIVFKAVLAIGAWGAASIGALKVHLTWLERGLAAAGAVALVMAYPASDGIGFALIAGVAALHIFRSRRAAATT
jgi:TRAP-type uncharacterized transport system fused permease subunit